MADNDNENVSLLTDEPTTVKPFDGEPINFFGRRKIYSSLKKSELTPEAILEILPSVLRIHDLNSSEIEYLWNYYKGRQPILQKEKKVRADINNKVLENHAYEIVEFKKSNDFGEPVQYVQKGEKDSDKVNPEISLLNKFMESEDKSSLDLDLSEWQCVCGTAYRWFDTDTEADEDEAPFELAIPDPRRTFVVRSSDVKEEQLFCGTYSWFTDKEAFQDTMVGVQFVPSQYRIITIYTDDYVLNIREGTAEEGHKLSIINQTINVNGKEISVNTYPLQPKGQRIIEYPLNNARMGIIEIVMSQLNAINKVKSDDLDGIDQFVQSLLVFINQDVTVDDVKELEEAGAIKVFSNDPSKPADVKLLTQQLLHSETKIVTDDLYDKMLTILGIPRLNDKASGGDTGQARLLGEGWTMAYQRAKQDDLNFKKAERIFLKAILNICKDDVRNVEDKIKNLKISDIDIKIPRDKSDNMLTKAQTLLELLQAGVYPETAYTVVGLFSDPHDVYEKSAKYQGEDFWRGDSANSNFNTSINGRNISNANNSSQEPTNRELGKNK